MTDWLDELVPANGETPEAISFFVIQRLSEETPAARLIVEENRETLIALLAHQEELEAKDASGPRHQHTILGEYRCPRLAIASWLTANNVPEGDLAYKVDQEMNKHGWHCPSGCTHRA